MDLLTVRALLFTPANRKDRFEKAKECGADGVIFDLEDAVSLAEKDQARELIFQYFKENPPQKNFLRCLRINTIKTNAGLKDLSALIENNVIPDVIMIPKVETAAEVFILDSLFSPSTMSYIVLIETAQGLIAIDEIVNASSNIKALAFGAADFTASIGAELNFDFLLLPRIRLVCAAAAKGMAVLDTPYFKIGESDEEMLAEFRRIKSLGFTGKLAIHPTHIQPILAAFTPNEKEIAHAKRIVDAYEKAEGNVCEVDGKMIDVPIVRLAKRVLALTNAKK